MRCDKCGKGSMASTNVARFRTGVAFVGAMIAALGVGLGAGLGGLIGFDGLAGLMQGLTFVLAILALAIACLVLGSFLLGRRRVWRCDACGYVFERA
jgi:hypothetical protein